MKKPGESVMTYADHEVIVPPNKLAKAVTRAKPGAAMDHDPVARAEEALAGLSSEFATWMESECERLEKARLAVGAKGFGGDETQVLFRAAHDIKGEAATFGFPLIAPVADSLCRLLEYAVDPTRIPMALVDQHVDAVRAMIRENAYKDDKTARKLSEKLRSVTDEFLVATNKDRPDMLAAILAPPLAPSG